MKYFQFKYIQAQNDSFHARKNSRFPGGPGSFSIRNPTDCSARFTNPLQE